MNWADRKAPITQTSILYNRAEQKSTSEYMIYNTLSILISTTDGRVRILRQQNESMDLIYKLSVQAGGGSVMVRGRFSWNTLHMFNTNQTAWKYHSLMLKYCKNDVIQNHLKLEQCHVSVGLNDRWVDASFFLIGWMLMVMSQNKKCCLWAQLLECESKKVYRNTKRKYTHTR